MDMYLRLDMELKRLFDALDDKVGEDNGPRSRRLTTVVPTYLARFAEGMPTVIATGNLMDELEVALQDRGVSPEGESWILRYSNDQIFLNHPLIYKRGLDQDAMARFVAQRCTTDPGLSKAIAACDAPAMAANDPVVARLVRGHRPGILATCCSSRSQDGLTTAEPAPPTDRPIRKTPTCPPCFWALACPRANRSAARTFGTSPQRWRIS